MKILLLKEPKVPSDPYETILKSVGSVHFVPVLSIKYINLDGLKKLFDDDDCSGVIFTSGNAVKATEAIFELSSQLDIDKWISKTCYVVGKATEKLASELGFTCRGSDCGNAEKLSKLIIEENLDDASKAFLFPCGQLKREILPKKLKEAGFQLTSQTVYETGENPNILESISKIKTDDDDITIVVLFSPSGLRFSLPKLKSFYGENLDSLHIAAIGSTTADACTSYGIQPCCVAENPTPESLYSSIIKFVNSNVT